MERETVVDHGPYQARVAALAGGAIEARLDAWAAEHGEPVGGWRRVFGRLEPGRSPWAVLTYEADGGPTVRVLLGEPAAGQPLGPVEIARCTADPALPGLRRCWPRSTGPRWSVIGPATDARSAAGPAATVRYVKVAARATDAQVDARALWAARGWRVQLRGGRAARLGRRSALELVRRCPRPPDRRIDARTGWRDHGPPDRCRAGRAPTAPTAAAAHEEPADQLDRTGRAIRRAAAAAPELADRLEHARECSPALTGRCRPAARAGARLAAHAPVARGRRRPARPGRLRPVRAGRARARSRDAPSSSWRPSPRGRSGWRSSRPRPRPDSAPPAGGWTRTGSRCDASQAAGQGGQDRGGAAPGRGGQGQRPPRPAGPGRPRRRPGRCGPEALPEREHPPLTGSAGRSLDERALGGRVPGAATCRANRSTGGGGAARVEG